MSGHNGIPSRQIKKKNLHPDPTPETDSTGLVVAWAATIFTGDAKVDYHRINPSTWTLDFVDHLRISPHLERLSPISLPLFPSPPALKHTITSLRPPAPSATAASPSWTLYSQNHLGSCLPGHQALFRSDFVLSTDPRSYPPLKYFLLLLLQR